MTLAGIKMETATLSRSRSVARRPNGSRIVPYSRAAAGANIELDQRHHLHAASEIHDFSIRRGVFVPIHFSDPSSLPRERRPSVSQ